MVRLLRRPDCESYHEQMLRGMVSEKRYEQLGSALRQMNQPELSSVELEALQSNLQELKKAGFYSAKK